MVKAIVTTEEFAGLPKEWQAEYSDAKDGKHTLKVEDVEGLALRGPGADKALASERGKREALEKQLKVFEGIDPEKAREALGKLDEIAKWSPDKKFDEALAQREGNLRVEFKKKLDESDGKSTKLLEQLDKAIRRNETLKAMAEHKAIPSVALNNILPKLRMEEDAKGDYYVRVYEDGSPLQVVEKDGSSRNMSVSEYVASLKKKPEFGGMFEGFGASGAGSSSSGDSGGAKQGSQQSVSNNDLEAVGRSIEDIAAGKVKVA